MRSWVPITAAAIALLASTPFVPPAGAVVIEFANTGFVTPSAACPPPPALPLDCALTATGDVVGVDGVYGPWLFSSPFMAASAGQPSPTQFLVSGTFLFDDPAPSNNDLFGTVAGIFDVVTFSTTFAYTVTGGSGAFAGASGTGSSLVQINPLNLTYFESGTLSIPEPATLTLVLGALLPLVLARTRGGRARRSA